MIQMSTAHYCAVVAAMPFLVENLDVTAVLLADLTRRNILSTATAERIKVWKVYAVMLD